jgi:hypothetical protein
MFSVAMGRPSSTTGSLKLTKSVGRGKSFLDCFHSIQGSLLKTFVFMRKIVLRAVWVMKGNYWTSRLFGRDTIGENP